MKALAASIASELLKCRGIAVIWDLHNAAAAAHRLSNQRAAEILIEIADAAEQSLAEGCAPYLS